jgi:hypothetical protein
MRRSILLPGMCLLIVVAGCSQKPGGEVKEDPPEVKWAQKIAEEFLETLRIKEYTQQKALTTKAFQETHQPTSGVYRVNDGVWLKSWTCTDKTLAPGGQEISLSGTAVYECHTFNEKDLRPGDWTVTLLKDKDNGRWLVNYVRISIDMTRRLDQGNHADRQHMDK